MGVKRRDCCRVGSFCLTSSQPCLSATHCEPSLGLAGNTLLGLDVIGVVSNHKGAHGGAAAPAVPLDQGQLREHTAAAGHHTAHLDKVAQVPGPAGEAPGSRQSCAGWSNHCLRSWSLYPTLGCMSSQAITLTVSHLDYINVYHYQQHAEASC
jgi:hypothetical protein